MEASLLGAPVSLYAQAVPVEKLVQQGVTEVPKAYRRPVEQATDNSHNIPIIDFSNLTTSRGRIKSEIQRACEDWGFFHIINHGIQDKVMKDVLESCTAFFNLPFEEKMSYFDTGFNFIQERRTCYKTRFDDRSIADWRDYLHLSPYPSTVSLWPAELRDAGQKYFRELQDLGMQLLLLVSESLGLQPSRLEEALQRTHVNVTINRYLPCPQPSLVLGTRNHSDPGLFTILLENKVPGLQVLHQGSWMNVAPVPGSLIVNVGDHLEILSNGRYKSVEHRALANSESTRMSIGSFFVPSDYDHVIGPLPELVDEQHPAAYRSQKFIDYVRLFFKKSADSKETIRELELSEAP